MPVLLWQRNTSLCLYLPVLLAVTLTVVFMLVYQVAYKFSLDFPVVAYDSNQIKYFYPYFIKRNGFTKLLPLLRSSSQTLRRTSDFDSRLILERKKKHKTTKTMCKHCGLCFQTPPHISNANRVNHLTLLALNLPPVTWCGSC